MVVKLNKGIIFIVLILILIIAIVLDSNVFASNKTNNNIVSYWSTTNKPVFYGTTKITIRKGSINKLDLNDTRFRVFARDFEDGDLTNNIKMSNNINVNEIGTYTINYSVIDSHNNESNINVPVIVTDDLEKDIDIERTIYTIPSVWNMDLVGLNRSNYGDKQILGMYLNYKDLIEAKLIDEEESEIIYLNNDSSKEKIQTIDNKKWYTLYNTSDSVPFIKSKVLPLEDNSVDKTYKLELRFNNNVSELNYYHEGDSEKNFFDKWSNNKYAVIENEVIDLLVPLEDKELINNDEFNNIDDLLNYYKRVINKMDEMVGLEYNPVNITDQNVRTKYLIKPDISGDGSAYYTNEYIAITGTSISKVFKYHWCAIHEIAHGYQGSLGKGSMELGEVSNNILAHYIQTSDIYKKDEKWLNISEEKSHYNRIYTNEFIELDNETKLYMIINLFNYIESENTYKELYKWYRNKVFEGFDYNNEQAYIYGLSEIYDIDVTNYFKSWKIANTIKLNNNDSIYILDEVVNNTNKELIMENESISKYSIISSNKLKEYNLYII